ncbi:MAG: 3-phosphoshikimate 1-carboxyvinyltransferase [Lachnospiraceae bacterium]|nr:3-phosphoshikimate 1-carboxyvinyltransferase [Lachnospiraceae bacterium]
MSFQSTYYDQNTDIYHVPCLKDTVGQALNSPLILQVPGSKSITNRALLLATLAEGTSHLKGVLFSDDSRHFLRCVQDLGFETTVDEETRQITVTGHGGSIPRKEASLYVGSAGTAARFLTAYLGISHGTYHMDASEQMRRRPMAPLLQSLRELGCEVNCTDQEGFFPFTLKSDGFGKDTITINIDKSSQFLSALLISSCLSPVPFHIQTEGSHGMAYIEMTRKMMAQFGVNVSTSDTFVTPAGQRYMAREYQIEPDVSAACYFYACAPLLNVPVLVEQVHFDSLQGDVTFLHILEKMGCGLKETAEGIMVLPPTDGLHGVTVDMSACSDQAITLAALAPFADAPVTITGIGHIRLQESDRMQGIVNELTKMGIRCEMNSTEGGRLTIYPGIPASCVIDTYEDHRMAMGFSLIGLRVPDIGIHNPACCGKTFENYFQVLEETIVKKLQI